MKVAVFGVGNVGSRIVGYLKHCQEVGAIVACDPREEALNRIRDEERVAVTASAEDVFSDPQVKLVFITAVNDAHMDLSMRAMASGKAVMCEKPMVITLGDSKEMTEAAARYGGFLQIGLELRYSKLYMQIKHWIGQGLLGTIVNMHCNYISSAYPISEWGTKKQASGGLFVHKLCHYADLFRWWTGDEVSEIYSVSAPNVIPYYNVRDNYHSICRFRNGAVGHLTFIMAQAATFRRDLSGDVIEQQRGDGHDMRLNIVGTKGAAETDIFSRTIKRWEFGESPEGFTSDLVETLTWPAKDDFLYYHNMEDQTRDIVRRVSKGLPPSISPEDAYQTMRLCYAADESADTGKVVYL